MLVGERGVLSGGWLAREQAWARMEEAQGALQRAEELRSFRLQGFNEIVLPSNFGAGLSPDALDSPFNTVVSTVGTPSGALSRRLPPLCF